MKCVIPDTSLTVAGPVHTAAIFFNVEILKSSSKRHFHVTHLEASS